MNIRTDEATVYIALGSNMGDRAAHLHAALRGMRAFLQIMDTSFLYESPPAYILDQPPFLNAVCCGTTILPPQELLTALQRVEQQIGRQKTVRYGPRRIDLDILFYGDAQIAGPDLHIPHPRLDERDFVLQPLCDLAPDLRHPASGQTMQTLWTQLNTAPLPKVMPVGGRLWTWREKTRIMGILNLTPDSFSGDGLLPADSAATTADADDAESVVARAAAQAQRFVDEGADCLDIGGQSTRPGHALVGEAAEIDRVVPVIRAVADAVDAPISVDTFRAPVARAALEAGASLINDVWGLRFDPALGTVAAEAWAPLVLMHNRLPIRDPAYPAHLRKVQAEQPVYGDIIQDIHEELAARIQVAQRAGLPRWLLISDPGVGFGKGVDDNLELVRRLHELTAVGYPLLFGPSRKRFVGHVLGGLPAQERVEGTLAVCVSAIERGAHILRVHDVRAVSRAARMADAVLHGASSL